jgi:hypothetical protein
MPMYHVVLDVERDPGVDDVQEHFEWVKEDIEDRLNSGHDLDVCHIQSITAFGAYKQYGPKPPLNVLEILEDKSMRYRETLRLIKGLVHSLGTRMLLEPVDEELVVEHENVIGHLKTITDYFSELVRKQ